MGNRTVTDDTLFDSQNAAYAQAMFEEYARNPEAVAGEWRKLFENGAAIAIAEGLLVPDQMNDSRPVAVAASEVSAPARQVADPPAAAPVAPAPPEPAAAPNGSSAVQTALDEVPVTGPFAKLSPTHTLLELLPAVGRATALIQSFRDHGHQLAAIDPLGSEPAGHPQLSPAFYGTTTEELSELPASLVLHENGSNGDRSVADALEDLSNIYAGSIGYEFEHLDDHVRVEWLWQQVEAGSHLPELSDDERRAILRRVSETEGLEQFLHRTYLGQKRFSLEGNDMLVPMLDLVIDEAGRAGAKDVVLGMAHRGRLNVLTHTVGVSYDELLAEFEGASM